jgi:hypothetical protein
MVNIQTEKKFLQRIVTTLALIPILAGLDGALLGCQMLGGSPSTDVMSVGGDSQFRFLSGLFFAVGLAYLSTVPSIERRRERFDLLTALVFFGGLARLLGVAILGLHSLFALLALVIELLIAPGLCIWQHRVVNRVSG